MSYDFYKCEYIWIDGGQPTAHLRSKTKILPNGKEPPLWGFDGSSTGQAPGEASDCVLKPVFVTPDPVRGDQHKLALCEVLTTDMKPHPSNTRAACVETYEKYKDQEPWFGIEQEYTFFKGSTPLGWPEHGFPGPQGPYYCGVGDDEVHGRDIVEDHLEACLLAGLDISGINAEVMPGQWEFQIGPSNTVSVGDQIWMARYLLYRIAEDYEVNATLDPKPVKGDWNGAGAHTNFSTKGMRDNYDDIIKAAEALAEKAALHIEHYGHNVAARLTGLHETCSYKEFRYGVSDRGASVRIPWQVARDGKGYLEDRRPNANCDPYVVARLMTDTICSVL